jgi:DNA-binding NarL/FixJ family response regulator
MKKLTRRERELMPLLAEGLTYKEMAAKQCVSWYTVRVQVHSIYEKLEVVGMWNARTKAVNIWTRMNTD